MSHDDDYCDSDSPSPPRVPARGKAKKASQPADVSVPEESPKSRRGRISSVKQKENDKQEEDAKDAQIAKLKQQNKNLAKRAEKAKTELRERDVARTPPESEEEDEDVEMSSFSASFVSKGIVGGTAQKPLPKPRLRKVGGDSASDPTTPMMRFPLTDRNDNLSGGHVSPPARSDSEPERPQEHRKRARSSSPSPRRLSLKTGRADKRPRAVVEELPKAKFVAGKAPGSSRTNIKDYAEPAAKLLKATMHQYEVRIWTIDPFPKSELQTQWVKEIWEDVCKEAKERMELSDRMASMIKRYGSHARGTLKDKIRPLIAPTYHFKVGDSSKALKANQKLWKALLADSAFHYEDTAELMGYAGNPIIIESIRVLWFKTKAGRGIIYLQFFSPIALVTLALIFTAIEFCIEEYSTGRFQQGTFDEAFNKDRYETHLKDLTDWAALMPAVTDKIRQKMHDSCRTSTGAQLNNVTGRMSATNRDRALLELEAMAAMGDVDNSGEDDG